MGEALNRTGMPRLSAYLNDLTDTTFAGPFFRLRRDWAVKVVLTFQLHHRTRFSSSFVVCTPPP